MDPLRTIAELKGVFLTQEALALGYDDKRITRMVRAGLWHRVRRGAYVPADVWKDADSVRRHLIRMAAVHRSYGDSVAFSHVSAALLHGIGVWGQSLDRVHVTRLDDRTSRIERDVVHHTRFDGAREECDRIDGKLVVSPARAALQCGLIASTESALVTLDSVLHLGLASADEITTMFDAFERWPGSLRLQVAVRMADAGAQSVGESRCRWMFRCAGLPAPVLQYEVRDETGLLIATTDFGWPKHRMLGEFDGRVKYGRLLRPGQAPGDAVFQEKVREDAARRASQFGMWRVIWLELDEPRTTCARGRRLFDVAG